jgi:hypothetical protein
MKVLILNADLNRQEEIVSPKIGEEQNRTEQINFDKHISFWLPFDLSFHCANYCFEQVAIAVYALFMLFCFTFTHSFSFRFRFQNAQ